MKLGERMAKLETDINYIKKGQDELSLKMDNFIETSDKRYASKLSEKIVYGMVGTIVLGVLYMIMQGVLI